MQNEIQIDLLVLPESAKAELFDFYRILIDKYHHELYNAQNQNIYSSQKKEDILIGLFDGASDLAIRSEERP
jgi:hypothetical protein